MKSNTYSDYVSYDIQSRFRQKPQGPIRCPMCAGKLSESAIEPSGAMNDKINRGGLIYGSSFLDTCDECHWWCVREHYEFDDPYHKWGFDFLIFDLVDEREQEPIGDMSVDRTQPWRKALDDPKVYDDVQRLPNELMILFDGGITWEQMPAQWKTSQG